MKLLETLSNFLSSKDSKALLENTVSTSSDDSSSRQAGTGQTGKINNKGNSTANIDNSTTYNYNFNINIRRFSIG